MFLSSRALLHAQGDYQPTHPTCSSTPPRVLSGEQNKQKSTGFDKGEKGAYSVRLFLFPTGKGVFSEEKMPLPESVEGQVR